MKKKLTVVVLIGYPGSGKTTLRKRFVSQGYPACHVGEFIRQLPGGASRDYWEAYRKRGEPVPEMAETFISHLKFQARGGAVISDGFPRRKEEAQALIDDPDLSLVAVRLRMPGDERVMSYERQYTRALTSEGKEVDPDHFRRKIEAASSQSLEAWQLLRVSGVPYYEIDALLDPDTIWETVRDRLGLVPDQRCFEVEAFKTLYEVSRETGISSWLTGDSISFGFWGGRLGPPRYAESHEVVVSTSADASMLRKALIERSPSRTWNVFAVSEYLQESVSATDATHDPFRHYLKVHPRRWERALGRWSGETIEICFGPGAEADLRYGNLVLETALPLEAGFRELSEDSSPLYERLSVLFPGLAHELDYGWFSFPKLVSLRKREEGCRKERAVVFSEAQSIKAGAILDWHRAHDNLCPEVPPISANRLLGASPCMRVADQDSRVTLTEIASLASDREFRGWLYNQTGGVSAATSYDSQLADLQSLSFLRDCRLRRYKDVDRFGTRQSASHLGLGVDQHQLESALLVEIDEITDLSAEERAGIRIGVLVHDIGKYFIMSPYCPGAHTSLGRNVWRRFGPDWLTDRQKEVAGWVIAYHDILGRLARTIAELNDSDLRISGRVRLVHTSYRGAVALHEVVNAAQELGRDKLTGIAVLSAIYRADIGSVATLRPFLGMVHHLEDLLIV